MVKPAPVAAIVALAALSACGGEPARDDSPTDREVMLPAGMTADERIGKADAWDPRDEWDGYEYTEPPGDVDVLPAEFGAPETLYIGWAYGAASLRPFFVDMIKAAAPHVPEVVIVTESESQANSLYLKLEAAGVNTNKLYWEQTKLDSIWMRDYGPLYVRTQGGGKRIVDMRYYWGRFADDIVPTRLGAWYNTPVSRPPLDTEGGNFQSNGAGTCITTEMVLEQNVERDYDENDVAQVYADYLGCQKTVILPPLYKEVTGHVDMLATITSENEVLVGYYRPGDDTVNAKRLNKAAQMLEDAGFLVRRVPMPSNADGAFRSYTNSLALGSVVLVPVYADDTRYEEEALAVYKDAYPGRKIVPIDATDVIQWAGAIHCVTMTVNQ